MGQDKALLRIGGSSFLEAIAKNLGEVVPRIYIAGAGSEPSREAGRGPSGPTILSDPPGREGPLAGLQAGFEVAAGKAVLLASCDAPRVPAAAFRALRDAWDGAPDGAVVFEGAKGLQPFPGLYGPRAAAAIEAEWASGRGSLQGLLARLGTVRVIPAPCDRGLLADVDSPEDYEALLAAFRQGSR